MEKKNKIVIFANLLFWMVSKALAASLTNDDVLETSLQNRIRKYCEEEFYCLPSTTRSAPEKNRTFSTLTLTRVISDNANAFLMQGVVTETQRTKFLPRLMFPSHSGLGVIFILIECLSSFPVRLMTEFLSEEGETRSMEIVKAGLEQRVISLQPFFVDSLLFKLDTTSSPQFLNATCVMEENPPAPVIFSSRFTFSLKQGANGKPGKFNIGPNNLSRGYYAETVSTRNVLQVCAPMLPWNNGDPEKWLHDSMLPSNPKDDSSEEVKHLEESNATTWLIVNSVCSFLVILCACTFICYVKHLETQDDNPQALEMVPVDV